MKNVERVPRPAPTKEPKMRNLFLALPLMLLGTLPALAAPTAAQKDEFYRVCMGIAENAELCSCKADAASAVQAAKG